VFFVPFVANRTEHQLFVFFVPFVANRSEHQLLCFLCLLWPIVPSISFLCFLCLLWPILPSISFCDFFVPFVANRSERKSDTCERGVETRLAGRMRFDRGLFADRTADCLDSVLHIRVSLCKAALIICKPLDHFGLQIDSRLIISVCKLISPSGL